MHITPRLHHALSKASILHFQQKRKGDGSPYIMHPFAVALILSHHTEDEDLVIAGLLHDVLEDVPASKYSEEDMRRDFGDRVCEIVKEVTEDKDPICHEQPSKNTWISRKERYIENLKNDSQEGLMVACADKIHNLLSMMEIYKEQGEKIWECFNAPADKKLWFYKEVLDVLSQRLESKEMLEELELRYQEAEKMLL